MGAVRIRRGGPGDLDAMARLEAACFAVPWSRQSLEADLRNPLSVYYVAELDGTVVGYVGLWTVLDEGHINNVAVSPDHRRQRIATRLMETMLADTGRQGVARHTLEVRAGNTGARQLYRGLGFAEAGVRPHYYADNGEDAILLWRTASV